MVPENIHIHPAEDHWKFRGGRGEGSQKLKFLKGSMILNWNFQMGRWGGGGEVVVETKNLLWGRYGYFLEQHIMPSLHLVALTANHPLCGFDFEMFLCVLVEQV